MSHYYVRTDRVIIRRDFSGGGTTLEWVPQQVEEDMEAVKNTPFRLAGSSEYLYWNGKTRTMTGVIEDAEKFSSVEEAETAAFDATAFDGALVGHVHVVPAHDAMTDEHGRIEARKKAEKDRLTFNANRFRIPERGGGV